jgi:hypothetical protein
MPKCWWKDAKEMKKLVIFLSFYLFTLNASSLSLERVNVFGEKISACGLDSDSVTASLASTMRHNRILPGKGVNLYHQLTAINIGDGICAVNINLSFYIIEFDIFVPTLKRKLQADVTLCQRNELLTGPMFNLQIRANESAKKLADLCLLDIERK